MPKIFTLLLFLFPTFALAQSDPWQQFEDELNKQPKDSLLKFAEREISMANLLLLVESGDTAGIAVKVEKRLSFAFDVLNFCQRKYGKSGNICYLLGKYYILKENYPFAVVEFNNAVEFESSNYSYYELRGFCKKQLEDNYGANADYKIAINLAPGSYANLAKLYATRGGILIDLGKFEQNNQGRFDESLVCYSKAISLNGKEGFYHYQKAFLLGIKGDTKGACLSLSKAGELGYVKAYEMIKQHCSKD